MRSIPGMLLALILVAATAVAAENGGLVARWDCDEGHGDILHDATGRNHGRIHGARWVACGPGYALRFDGVDDYVACGADASLDLREAVTLETWVHPDAPATAEPGVLGKSFDSYAISYYQNGSCYMYVSGGGNGVSGPVRVGQWSHLVGVFDGKTVRLYINAQPAGVRDSAFGRISTGGEFTIGCVVGDAQDRDAALRTATHFAGIVDGVRVYSRPMPRIEIARHYNEQAAAKGLPALDLAKFGRLGMRLFPYPELGQLVVELDRQFVAPPTPAAPLHVEMKGAGQVRSETVTLQGAGNHVEAVLPLAGLADGEYVVRASFRDADGRAAGDAVGNLRLPVPAPTLPAPTERRVPPLPPVIGPPPYQCEAATGGGLVVVLKGVRYYVESAYSYPGGGENVLSSVPPAATVGEPEWAVKTARLDDDTYRIDAAGRHYTIERRVRPTRTRIEIEDRITNRTDDVLGIVLSNHVNIRGRDDVRNTIPGNPSVFVAQGRGGVGLVALDDIYQVHQRTTLQDGRVGIRDEHFGLDKGATYAVQWAIYPTGTDDYFDFVNQVRRDEGLNGHVDGVLELTGRWGPPPKEIVELQNIRYTSVCYLSHSLQNPHRSLEGWEFLQYPELQERMRKAIGETRAAYPGMNVMFHVAHSLYLTNRPAERFGDSILVDANGKSDHYGPNSLDYYGRYIAPELFQAGWRWWLFYPTMENSFGKLMLRAADVMIGDLGANAIWADGYIGGYAKGGYTYDRWDGHSVTTDPKTGRVTRKKGNVTYLSLPVLKAVVRKFADAGGVLITNDVAGPRSLWREKMITSCETGGGDQQPIASLYFGQTVTPLSDQTSVKTRRDVYRDILAKLDLGALYFLYGMGDIVREARLPSAYMYPITFESIHGGTVRGSERIVTKVSGAYGWPGDRALHAVHTFDARGQYRPNRSVTTVDADGVRTQLDLAADELAVVEKVPLAIEADGPVNLLLARYGKDGVELTLGGTGRVGFRVRDGPFAVRAGATYRLTVDDKPVDVRATGSTLTCDFEIRGPTPIRVRGG